VIDLSTLQGWLEKIGFEAKASGPKTFRLHRREENDASSERPLPPFYLQCSEHWVLLSMLPMLDAGAFVPEGISRLLLTMNRELRVAKFALDAQNTIVLCAELPTESLDFSELADAIEQVIQSARRFQTELAGS